MNRILPHAQCPGQPENSRHEFIMGSCSYCGITLPQHKAKLRDYNRTKERARSKRRYYAKTK